MSNPDLGQLMAKAKEMQDRLAEVQRELAARSVEASSGGGMVRAQVSGALRVVSLEIEPTLLESGDRAMLQDLTAAAVNAALTKAQEMMQRELQQASVSLGLPGGFPGMPS